MAEQHFIRIIDHEGVVQSLTRDVITYCTVVACIGTGWLLGSSAMQWAGFILVFFVLFAKANGSVKKMTVEEARDFLDSLPTPPETDNE